MERGRGMGVSVARNPREGSVFDWDMIARSSSLTRELGRERRERSRSRTLDVDTYLQDERMRIREMSRSAMSLERLGRSCSRERW